MVRRQVIALVAVAAVVALVAPLVLAEQRGNQKRNREEQREIEQLVKLVDGVMAGEAAPSDIKMSFAPYYLKSQEQRTFVPFVLDFEGAPEAPAVLYVRVVNPTATAGAEGKEKDKEKGRTEYPWDDVHFLSAEQIKQADGRLQRVFMAPPGTLEVYIAMKERLPERAPRDATPKMGVLRQQITVPDFWSGELTTSSIIVADEVRMLQAMPSPEEMRERPFVFGAQELVPARDMVFTKSEQLSTFFQVYNAALDEAGKPNLVMEYNFHRKENGTEKFFNKTAPQNVNASMLPPTFDPAKFPVPGGIEVPLTTFPEGDYRLEIKVTDKVSGKVVTRDVNFTVKAS